MVKPFGKPVDSPLSKELHDQAVWLTSCLTGLDLNQQLSTVVHSAKAKQLNPNINKQVVNRTLILTLKLVFSDKTIFNFPEFIFAKKWDLRLWAIHKLSPSSDAQKTIE